MVIGIDKQLATQTNALIELGLRFKVIGAVIITKLKDVQSLVLLKCGLTANIKVNFSISEQRQ